MRTVRSYSCPARRDVRSPMVGSHLSRSALRSSGSNMSHPCRTAATLTLYSQPVTITVQSVTQYGVIQLKSGSAYQLDPAAEYNIVVGEKVTLSAFLSNFTTSGLVVHDKDGNPFTGSYISTGCTLSAYVDGIPADRYVIVVVGDVNGDGRLTSSDYLLLKRHIVVEEVLTGAYLKAGRYESGR